jgi:hypothetical protein
MYGAVIAPLAYAAAKTYFEPLALYDVPIISILTIGGSYGAVYTEDVLSPMENRANDFKNKLSNEPAWRNIISYIKREPSLPNS